MAEFNFELKDWIKKAIYAFMQTNKFDTFDRTVNWLIETQLNRYGYFKEIYSDIHDISFHDDCPNPKEWKNENEKRLFFENHSLKIDNERLKEALKKGMSWEEFSAPTSPISKFKRLKYEKDKIKTNNVQIKNANGKIGDVSVNIGNIEVKKNDGI